MNKILAVLSWALLVAACSSTRGNLLSRVEYHDDAVVEREMYYYSDGNLVLATRVTFYNGLPDSSWTEYEIRRNGPTTDTIETINSIKRNIMSSDGTTTSYKLVGDEWKKTPSVKIHKDGRLIETVSEEGHIWFNYDSHGRFIGNTYELVNENGQIQKGWQTTEYLDDGLQSVVTTYYQVDSLPVVISGKTVYSYDKKGRILSREAFDPDETDDVYSNYLTDTYKYRGKKVIRIESLKEYKDGSYHHEPNWKYKEKYKHGLRTKIVAYMMKDGRFRKLSVNEWKYDFRAGVPIKSFVYSPGDYLIIRRPSQKTIWTYE